MKHPTGPDDNQIKQMTDFICQDDDEDNKTRKVNTPVIAKPEQQPDALQLLRKLFYERLPSGVKVEEIISEENLPLWRDIYSLLNVPNNGVNTHEN